MTFPVQKSFENFENLKFDPFESKDVLLGDSNDLDKNFYNNIQAVDTQYYFPLADPWTNGGQGSPTFSQIILCQEFFSWKFAFFSVSKTLKTFFALSLPESLRGS